MYWLDLRRFWGHGGGHVLAVRQNNSWTSGAPLTAQSSPKLRGYKTGEYLGENLFPSYGVGIQFILKPKDGIVGNLEYARGKGDNSGIYMKGGYSF